MNKHLAILAISSLLAVSAFGETNVGVSIGIYQPGVYGRIDIGSYPRPAVVYGHPIVIAPQPMVVRSQPVYLYVPPGHQKNWVKHCGRYDACRQPVYFVQESWVRERYEQQHRGHGEDHGHKDKKHKG